MTESLGAEVLPRSATESSSRVAAESKPELSIVVPCFNEEGAIESTVGSLLSGLPPDLSWELIVVDDGSTDGSAAEIARVCDKVSGARGLRHERNRGYGAALKTGLRRSRGRLVAITDADGSYPDARLGEMVAALDDADMIVGVRPTDDPHAPWTRRWAKAVLRRWVSWLAGIEVPDMNSGFRVFRRRAALGFLGLLPDGFSFTTTITLSCLRSGFEVRWIPIETAPRIGRSKIRPVRDLLAFFHLILRTGFYFAPLRMLLPLVAVFALLTAASGAYDAFVLANLTEKTLILLTLTTNTFLLALIADMLDKRSR